MRGSATPVLAALILGAACNGSAPSDGPPPADERRSELPAVPATEPDVRGTITRLVPGLTGAPSGVLIEEKPGGLETGGAKALMSVVAGTRIYRRTADGLVAITFAQLQTGQRAQGWFDGPVMESYPVQGTAGTIVVD